MMQGHDIGKVDTLQQELGEITISKEQLDKNAQVGDSISGSWEGVVKEMNPDGNVVVTLHKINADVANQADSAMRDMGMGDNESSEGE